MPCEKWKCCEVKTNKRITLKDKKSPNVFILINNLERKVEKIKLDECDDYKYIGKRCDYVLNCKIKKLTIFIELKGKKFENAVKQLENSITKLRNLCNSNKIFAFCVLTRFPKTGVDTQNLKKQFMKKGIIFDNKNKKLEKDIEKL